MIQVLALYGILASTFTFGKILLTYLSPIFLIGLRMTIAGSLILLINGFLGRNNRIKKSDILFFLVISLVHIFIPYTSEFMGLQTMSPACAALMFNLTPFFTAFFSYLIFKEYMTLKKWIGFAIGLLGVAYTIPKESIFCYECLNFGYFFMIVSVISSSLGWTLVRKLLQKGYSSLQINGIAMFIGGLEALSLAHFFEVQSNSAWYTNLSFWTLLFTIIIISNFLFYNLYGLLLKKYSATLLSFVGFLTPLFTALYDFIFLEISISLEFYIATIIVACGIYIFYQEELRQGYILK